MLPSAVSMTKRITSYQNTQRWKGSSLCPADHADLLMPVSAMEVAKEAIEASARGMNPTPNPTVDGAGRDWPEDTKAASDTTCSTPGTATDSMSSTQTPASPIEWKTFGTSILAYYHTT